MYRFNNDYSQIAHPAVMKALSDTEGKSYGGYGIDPCCKKAAKMIKDRLNAKNSDVHFLVGGTQTNFIAIDAALRPYEEVICADSGHINAHEAGAVERCGHKIVTIPNSDGKISASAVAKIAQDYKESVIPEHVTVPRMVYISFPTEYGTIYTKKELSDLYKVCKKYKMYLFVDGARLAYGLGAEKNDVKFEDFAKLCDLFYLGGTKCGAMFGEALVINNDDIKPYFRNMLKQNGAMLAKGWLLGTQFSALMKDDLYFKLGQDAVKQADRLKKAFARKGIKEYIKSPTNQIFVVIDKALEAKLSKDFVFEFEGKYDSKHDIVRFCTSWYTKDEEIDALIKAL